MHRNRLSVIPLSLPPLRDRKQGIPPLAFHFVRKCCQIQKSSLSVDHAVYDSMVDCPFPGNVRELENLMHPMAALAQGCFVIRARLFLVPRPGWHGQPGAGIPPRRSPAS
jgi:Nif-specific regulatory protein